jgi:hypothetical protein
VAAAGLAEEQPESECEEGACECCPEPKRWIVTGGLDYATDYVFRGYRLQSGGLILQPFVTAAYAHHVSDDITLTPYLTLWQSFDLDGAEEVELPSLSLVALGHCFGLVEGSTTRLHTATHQLELYGGVVTQIGDLTLDGKYMLDSASGESFSSMQEIGLKVGYDLAGLWTDEPAAARTFGLPAADGRILLRDGRSPRRGGRLPGTGLGAVLAVRAVGGARRTQPSGHAGLQPGRLLL